MNKYCINFHPLRKRHLEQKKDHWSNHQDLDLFFRLRESLYLRCIDINESCFRHTLLTKRKQVKRVSRNYKAAREVSGCCSIIVIISMSAFPNRRGVCVLPSTSQKEIECLRLWVRSYSRVIDGWRTHFSDYWNPPSTTKKIKMLGGIFKLTLSFSALILFVTLLWQASITDALPVNIIARRISLFPDKPLRIDGSSHLSISI